MCNKRRVSCAYILLPASLKNKNERLQTDLMESKHYYKLVDIARPVGEIITTQEKVDSTRVKRYSKLTDLFEQIYNCSKEYELPIGEIIFHIKASFLKRRKYKIENLKLKKCIKDIRKESSRQHFRVMKEFRWFNDYILEKAKKEIHHELGLVLPNRFESSYFFESIEDCYKYYFNLPRKYHTKIIEVEFIEQKMLKKFDNKLVSEFQDHYTSDDFFNQAKLFLLEGASETPLFEFVFEGKYKVTNHYRLL
jgi:hypothetical protein